MRRLFRGSIRAPWLPAPSLGTRYQGLTSTGFSPFVDKGGSAPTSTLSKNTFRSMSRRLSEALCCPITRTKLAPSREYEASVRKDFAAFQNGA